MNNKQHKEFQTKAPSRRLLKISRITRDTSSPDLNSSVFICNGIPTKETKFNLPDDIKNCENFDINDIDENFGNLKEGIVKVVNISERKLFITSKLNILDLNKPKDVYDFFILEYGEDKYFVKKDDVWYFFTRKLN